MADSLKGLDKLILEVLQESNLIEREQSEKGGVQGPEQAGKTTSNLGLDIGEIISILSVGTESEKILKSSSAAIETLLASFRFEPNFNSAEGLAQSFSFFDLQSESVKRDRCSSFGALLSKYSLSAGLIAILDQFNGAASGFVNEAFVAKILGGQTVPVGGGGIEDVQVRQGDSTIGVSLKTKKVSKLGGSLTQLLETLGISFYKPAKRNKKGEYTTGIKRIRDTTEIVVSEEYTSRRRPIAFAKVDPNPIVDVLYYLSFFKSEGSGMQIKVYRISNDDLNLAKASPIEIEGQIYYDATKVNDILSMTEPVTREQSSYELSGNYSVEGFNEALRENAAEVFESLKALDAWYGQLKQGLINYVSSLEKESFDKLQGHLSLGAGFTFKAFDIKSCD
jgi:hypothetical protein